MALRLSTGLRNKLNAGGSLKKSLHDGVIRIYTGSQPAAADDAVTGTLLASITLVSGALTEGTESTPQRDTATFTYGSNGDIYKLVVNGNIYSYTTIAGDDAPKTAEALAKLVDKDNDVVVGRNSNVIYVSAKHPGVTYTLANTGTTTPGNLVLANTQANVRLNGLQFGAVTAGVLTKEAGVWSGVAVATGTAGWFRFQGVGIDDDTLSTVFVRLDGNIATSGANMNMSSTSITSGATQTVDTFSVTEPAS